MTAGLVGKMNASLKTGRFKTKYLIILKKSRFSGSQIDAIIKAPKNDHKTWDICRNHSKTKLQTILIVNTKEVQNTRAITSEVNMWLKKHGIKSPSVIRASVISNWIKRYKLREAQYHGPAQIGEQYRTLSAR